VEKYAFYLKECQSGGFAKNEKIHLAAAILQHPQHQQLLLTGVQI
jgi:hypothetical protein